MNLQVVANLSFCLHCCLLLLSLLLHCSDAVKLGDRMDIWPVEYSASIIHKESLIGCLLGTWSNLE